MKDLIAEFLVGKKFSNLNFEHGYPTFRFEDVALHFFCSWRLLRNLEIITGSYDDENISVELISNIASIKCNMVESAFTPTDLTIHLSSDYVHQIISCSSQYESWNIVRSDGRMIIGGPGNSWSTF
jgi:hypothetical protein